MRVKIKLVFGIYEGEEGSHHVKNVGVVCKYVIVSFGELGVDFSS